MAIQKMKITITGENGANENKGIEYIQMSCRVESACAKVNKKLGIRPFLRSIFCCVAVWMAGRRLPLGAVRAKMLMIYNLAYLVV